MAIQIESTCGAVGKLAKGVNEDGNSIEFQKLLGAQRACPACGTPMRVPKPAAGMITKTFIGGLPV